MKTLTNQKVLTIAFIITGLSLIGINFLIFKGVDKRLDDSLSKLPQLSKLQKANASATLPDITAKQPISDSKIRNNELAKIINSLPYTDTENNITISYGPQTKLVVAGITSAKNLEDYRNKKFMLEQKLYEFGAENLCNLVLVWAPPFELKKDLEPSDVHTFDCPN